MTELTREGVAAEYETTAAELERAAAHLRTTAAHFRAGEVPRACAHAWAAQGHVRRAEAMLGSLAEQHADRAVPGVLDRRPAKRIVTADERASRSSRRHSPGSRIRSSPLASATARKRSSILTQRDRAAMSIRPTTLLDHVVWADTQAYGALASLSSGSAEHTQAVRIYTHLAAAAHIWLARLEGRRPEHAVWPTALSLAEAHALAEASLAGLRVVAAAAEGTSAPATGLSRIVAYRTSTGQPLQNSVADILTHVALHGSYHRGQLALLTRQGGGTPANATDFVVFAHGTDADASPLPPSSAG